MYFVGHVLGKQGSRVLPQRGAEVREVVAVRVGQWGERSRGRATTGRGRARGAIAHSPCGEGALSQLRSPTGGRSPRSAIAGRPRSL